MADFYCEKFGLVCWQLLLCRPSSLRALREAFYFSALHYHWTIEHQIVNTLCLWHN